MKNYLVVIGFALSLMMTACEPPQNKLRTRIEEAEMSLSNDSLADISITKGDSLIAMYLNYNDQYKDDTLCADYFFRAADLSMKIGKAQQAVDLYGKIQRFPNYRKTARALFLQGFISENNLHDIESAKAYYERFLKQYPNHAMAGDVKLMLDNIGISPEEMVKQFEAKLAAQDSLAQAK